MRILALDPGYTKCGIVAVEFYNDEAHVTDAHVLFPYKKGKAKDLEKVEIMIDTLLKFKSEAPDFFEGDALIVEGQQCYGRGRANPNVLIRMGAVTGAYYALCDVEDRTIVLPSTWTQGRPKEDNHSIILQKTIDLADWPWYNKIKKADMEHAIDAVGMAIWRYENV